MACSAAGWALTEPRTINLAGAVSASLSATASRLNISGIPSPGSGLTVKKNSEPDAGCARGSACGRASEPGWAGEIIDITLEQTLALWARLRNAREIISRFLSTALPLSPCRPPCQPTFPVILIWSYLVGVSVVFWPLPAPPPKEEGRRKKDEG